LKRSQTGSERGEVVIVLVELAGASEDGAAPDVVIPPGSAFLVLGLITGDEFKLAGLRLEKTAK